MKKTIISIVVGFGLFLFGCSLFLLELFLSGGGFSSIEKIESPKLISQPHASPLLQGEKIVGEFVAQDNNLGSIKVNFDSFNRLNNDVLVFRIKEKGKDWFYIHNYPVRQFYSLPLYPFGFPLQVQSRGKRYQFEFESKYGSGNNSVALDVKNYPLITRYTFDKEDILKSPFSFALHSAEKIILSLTFREKLVTFLINQLPLYLYLIIHLLVRVISGSSLARFFKEEHPSLKKFEKMVVLAVLNVGVILEIIVLKESFSVILLLLVSVVLFVAAHYRLKSREIYLFSLAYLLVTIPLSIFKLDILVDRVMVWVYLFFLSGTVVLFYE